MMFRQFFNVNTRNGIKIFDAEGLKVMCAVPEKHIINFFGLNNRETTTFIGGQMVVTDMSDSSGRADALGKLGLSYGIGMVGGSLVGGVVTKHLG